MEKYKYFNTNEDILYDFHNNHTITVSLRDVKEDVVKVPSCIVTEDGNYFTTEITDINNKQIIISQFLRNKYKGKNVSYMAVSTPLANIRLEKDLLKMLDEYKALSYSDICDIIKKKQLNQRLSEMSRIMEFENDEELLKLCKKEIEQKNFFNTAIERTLGKIEISEKVIKPNFQYLKDVYDQCMENHTHKFEFNIYFFGLYLENSNILYSSDYWDNNLRDLYIYAFAEIRDSIKGIQ